MAYLKKKIPREVRWLRNRLKRFEHVVEEEDQKPMELIEEGKDHVTNVSETVNRYNEVLSEADALRSKLDEQVQTARDIHERLRMNVIAAYGRDSVEYEQLGGTRPSDIDYSRKNKSDNQQQ